MPFFTGKCRYRFSIVNSRSRAAIFGAAAAGLSLNTIWSTLMCPQPPVALSTIWICAVLPANSPTSHDAGANSSLPPGLVFGPVAVRTTLPATSRFMHVLPS